VFVLVSTLQLELSGFGRNDGGTRAEGPSQHDCTVGVGLRARIGKRVKPQLKGAEKGDILAQAKLISSLFGIVA
jgi:hypothetical protein